MPAKGKPKTNKKGNKPSSLETVPAVKESLVVPAGVVSESKKKKRKSKRVETYSTYVYKVLKQVHPGTGISRRAMSILNSFLSDVFERIGHEAGHLVKSNRKATLTSREIQTATRLVLPSDLAKHAMASGLTAVTKYGVKEKKKSKQSKTQESSETPVVLVTS